MLKGIYLACGLARHFDYNLDYQDIDNNCNPTFIGNMLDQDLSNYDYVVATPPCNWWSKLNMFRFRSWYAWLTLSLLPLTIIKLSLSEKPFIIENVINRKRFVMMDIYKLIDFYNLHLYEVGRHIYITNTDFVPNDEGQKYDFKSIDQKPVYIGNDINKQGGSNVHLVIDQFLKYINELVL